MGAFKEPHGCELKDLYVDPMAAEAEKQAAMVINTMGISPDLAAHRILVKLESMGFIR